MDHDSDPITITVADRAGTAGWLDVHEDHAHAGAVLLTLANPGTEGPFGSCCGERVSYETTEEIWEGASRAQDLRRPGNLVERTTEWARSDFALAVYAARFARTEPKAWKGEAARCLRRALFWRDVRDVLALAEAIGGDHV